MARLDENSWVVIHTHGAIHWRQLKDLDKIDLIAMLTHQVNWSFDEPPKLI